MAAQSEPIAVEAPPVVAIQKPAMEAEPPLVPVSEPNAPKAVKPPAKAPAKAADPMVGSQRPPKQVAPAVARAQEPQLDVKSLITRLRETKAIGVMTKLALKNQVDDLLKRFRTHYEGGQKSSVAELRQAYNMLVLKVLSLVQDGDPSLASSIAGSREAIWNILTDREKFSSIV